MSGENGKTNASGMQPEALRPTVIKSKGNTTQQPTVITQSESLSKVDRIHAPTVLLQPTIIKQMDSSRAVLTHVSVVKTTKTESRVIPTMTPTIIAGSTVRKSVSVEIFELAECFVGKPKETLVRVKKILNQIIIEALTIKQCNQWGLAVQSQYKNLVDESITLTQDKKVQKGTHHLKRLYTIFDDVYENFQCSKGFSFSKKHSPWEVFEKHQSEINQIRNLLEELLPKLEDVRRKLDEVSEKLLQVADSLDVEVLAAEYLMGILSEDDRKKQTLEHRSASLIETSVSIHEGEMLRSSVSVSITELTIKIQETILTSLPAWIEQMSFACNKQDSHTDTDMYNFRLSIEDMLQQLR